MEYILNILLKFIVLFVGWIIFPDAFQFRDIKAVLVTATLLIVIYILIILFLDVLSDIFESMALAVVAIIVGLFLNAIAILLVSTFYQGFHFGGDITALIITTIAMNIFTFTG